MAEVPQHNIQTQVRHPRAGKAPQVVTRRAYEVYSHLYGTSQSAERLHERGGFGLGELIAFLYASSFPKNEWSVRVSEAMRGLEI